MLTPYVATQVIALSSAAVESCRYLIDHNAGMEIIRSSENMRVWREVGAVEIGETAWSSSIRYREGRTVAFLDLDRHHKGKNLCALASISEEAVVSITNSFSSFLQTVGLDEEPLESHINHCYVNLNTLVFDDRLNNRLPELSNMTLVVDEYGSVELQWEQAMSCSNVRNHLQSLVQCLNTQNNRDSALYESASTFSLSHSREDFYLREEGAPWPHDRDLPSKLHISNIGLSFKNERHLINDRGVIFVSDKSNDIDQVASILGDLIDSFSETSFFCNFESPNKNAVEIESHPDQEIHERFHS